MRVPPGAGPSAAWAGYDADGPHWRSIAKRPVPPSTEPRGHPTRTHREPDHDRDSIAAAHRLRWRAVTGGVLFGLVRTGHHTPVVSIGKRSVRGPAFPSEAVRTRTHLFGGTSPPDPPTFSGSSYHPDPPSQDLVSKSGGNSGYNTGYEFNFNAAVYCEDDTPGNASVSQVLTGGGGASSFSLRGFETTGIRFQLGK